MPENNVVKSPALQFIVTSLRWSWLWIGTAALFGLIGFAYVAFLKKDVWVASQGLMVRDEANGAVMRLGRFQSQTDMKAAQETIIELSRNPQVIFHALQNIGPEPSLLNSNKDWPTAIDIENAAKTIEVRAPRGAELGTTEVLYLDTKHSSRRRAHDLNVAICDALVDRLQEVRRLRADGVLAELTAARDVAKGELKSVTDKLQAIERTAGEDLGDLRGMTDASSNTNSARIQLDAVKTEIRTAETQLKQMALDLELAEKAFNSPEELLSPNSLVNSQPGLKKLREGLADARLNASQLQGRFTASHPLVQAATKAEQEIQVRLREELGLARQAIVNDREIASQRLAALQKQESQLTKRIESMANIRADYANLLAEVRSRSQVLQDTERQLSEVQAARDAALSSSLVTRIDTPFSSEKPVGPGKTTILAGSALAGLFFGFGTLFLLIPMEGERFGRRRSDYAGQVGRRESDRTMLRRASDMGGAANVETPFSQIASAPPTTDNRSQTTATAPRTVPTRRTSDIAFSRATPSNNAAPTTSAPASTTIAPAQQPAAQQPTAQQPASASSTTTRTADNVQRVANEVKPTASGSADAATTSQAKPESKVEAKKEAATVDAVKPIVASSSSTNAASTVAKATSADTVAPAQAATTTTPDKDSAKDSDKAPEKSSEVAIKPFPVTMTTPQAADTPRKPLPTIPRQR